MIEICKQEKHFSMDQWLRLIGKKKFKTKICAMLNEHIKNQDNYCYVRKMKTTATYKKMIRPICRYSYPGSYQLPYPSYA